ncbi:VCBS repeat-containing protein [Candidatus Clostridium stratigraminis]|uniref:VCBS repeat-containing protein n=1 Tax=Candidatus Clostridium stratigraminis TaxID=3381661 RepID=A0ABW8SYB3_9CLOT
MSIVNPFPPRLYLLDMKLGDVTGDGIPDKVSLFGSKPDGSKGIFADNITVVIEDGSTKQRETITPEFNSGYNASLFLGDFTKDKVDDIKVSIDAGGSGGYGFFYIYSFKNNNLQEIFNFDSYNKEYIYKVDYADFYKVHVANVLLNKLFVLDISYKGYDYLSLYYNEDGRLKKPIQGEVLAIGALIPVVNNERSNSFDLLAFQRIIGTTNSDTLGYIQNFLTWDGHNFVSSRIFAAIPGTNLISLY